MAPTPRREPKGLGLVLSTLRGRELVRMELRGSCVRPVSKKHQGRLTSERCYAATCSSHVYCADSREWGLLPSLGSLTHSYTLTLVHYSYMPAYSHNHSHAYIRAHIPQTTSHSYIHIFHPTFHTYIHTTIPYVRHRRYISPPLRFAPCANLTICTLFT